MRRMLLLFAALVTARTAAAQVQGRVVTEEGLPLANAVVDLWSADSLAGRVVTGPSGRFEFAGRTAGRLFVRAIGFEPRGVDVVGDSVVVVQLRVRVADVAPIDVNAASCRRREDADARRRWRQAAAMYSWTSPPGKPMLASRSRVDARTIPDSLFGLIPLDSLGFGVSGTTRFAVDVWSERRLSAGYPVPSASNAAGDLEGNHAAHFATAAFGALHRFLLTDDPATIRFCPRPDEGSRIEGVLHFTPSGSIERIEWIYTLGRGSAGGAAGFVQPVEGASWPLRPAWGLRWERLRDGMRRVINVEYRGWGWETAPGSAGVN